MSWPLGLLAILIAGCTVTRVEGECTVVRKVEWTFECLPGGKAEHMLVLPPSP